MRTLVATILLASASLSLAQTDPNDRATKTLSQPDPPDAAYLNAHPGAVALPHNPGQLRFRNADGRAAAILGPLTHQDPKSGAWVPNAPVLSETNNGWRLDNTAIGIVVKKAGQNHVISQTYSDPASKRDSVLSLTVPSLTYDRDFSFHFSQDSLTWNLAFDSIGRFTFSSAVSQKRGPRQYTFPLDSSESLAPNAAGNLAGDGHALLSRPLMIPKTGKPVPCSAWSWSRKDGASFTCDDSAFKNAQLPYTIDPTVYMMDSSSMSDLGTRTIIKWAGDSCDDSGENCSWDAGDIRADYNFYTGNLIPSGGVLVSASCGFQAMVDFGMPSPPGDVACSVTFNNQSVSQVEVFINYFPPPDASFHKNSMINYVSLTVTWQYPVYPTSTLATSPSGLQLTVDGTVCYSPCSYQWAPGSGHTIAAVSPQGSGGTQLLYSAWSDGGAQSHSITAPSSDTPYIATFTTQYYLTTSAATGGTISPASAWYNAGSVVSVAASANTGYQFAGFSGGLSGTATPQNVAMNGPVTVTAGFNVSHTITSNPAGRSLTVDGSACTAPCTFYWSPGSNHTIAAAAQSGGAGMQYAFASWSDSGAASHSVTAQPAPYTLTALFNTQYYLTTSAAAGGNITPVSGWYNSGAVVSVAATPNSNYQFTSFTGDLAGSGNPQNVNMSAARSVTAGFLALQTVTSSPAPLPLTVDGVACNTPCTFAWSYNSSHTIAAAATIAGPTGTQYLFANWTDFGAASHGVTASATPTVYTAAFTTQFYLTTSAGTGGTINPASAWYNSGAIVSVSATPNTGYQFTGFTGNLSGTGTPQNVTMTAAKSVTAGFAVPPPPSISGITPNPATIGTSVTIAGSNFGASGTVTFHGIAATPTAWTSGSITVPVPSGTPLGSGNVVVTVAGQASAPYTFTVADSAPSVAYPVPPLAPQTGWTHTFTVTYSDPDGAADVSNTQLLFMGYGPSACYVVFSFSHGWNGIWLMDDAGASMLGPVYPGDPTPLENHQCKIDGVGTSVTFSSDPKLVTLNLAMIFKPPYGGPHTISTQPNDWAVLTPGWVDIGTWSVPAASTYTVSGQVNLYGLTGVTMTLALNGTLYATQTYSGGTYQFTGIPAAGPYTVTPSKTGVTFSPTSASMTTLAANWTVPTFTAQIPDLTVTSAHTGNFTQGQTGATYTITATNAGAGPTTGTITVTEAVPTGLTATNIAGSGWTCTQPAGPCTRGDVWSAAAQLPAITLTVNVAANAPASVTNTVTVSGGGEANTANDQATDPTNIGPLPPDLTITSTHTGTFTQGQAGATYTITVRNIGATATTGTITAADTLPTGLTAVNIAGSGWTCTQPAGPCSRTDIWSGGASLPAITLTVNVAANAPASVTNTVTVSGGGETNTGNDQATDVTAIVSLASLSINSTHSGTFTQADTGHTYTITVSNAGNAGPTNGTAVVVTETIPQGMIPTSIAGSNWTCTQPAGPCSTTDVRAGGASYPPITLTVSISPNAPASTTNTVTVSGGGSFTASASDPTTIAAMPRYSNPLAFAVPASVVAGVPVTMSITYTNDNGPGAIIGGHVAINDCEFRWDSAGNIHLYGGSHGILDATGVLTTAPTIWAGACSIDLANSSLSTPANNPKARVLSLRITFAQQNQRYADAPMKDFTGYHEVYASGDSLAPDGSPLTTGDVDLGAIFVSPGNDFLLIISPGNGNTLTVAPFYTATAMVTVVGVNGFSGPVTLSQPYNSNSCFSIYAPTTLSVPSQGSVVGGITIRNNCSNSTSAQLTYDATANVQGVNRLWHQAITPTFIGGSSTDFSVSVDAPSMATLAANGSVSYPVYVQPINGQTGTVNLSVIGTLPTGVTAQFDQAQLTLDGSNTVSAQLTLNSTASTPGGSFPITVKATLGSVMRTASFNVGTQVTTFRFTSATGSPIIQNDGQEVEADLTVPATNAPTYTTCDSPDPDVTCAVVSTTPGTIKVRMTATPVAVHGLRVLKFNGIATSFDLFVADRQFQITPPSFSVVAGGPAAEASVDLPDPFCKGDIFCSSTFGYAYSDDSSISIWSIPMGNQLTIRASAPDWATEGPHNYTVNACNNYDGYFFCLVTGGVVYVAAAPPPCGNAPLALSPHSIGLRNLPLSPCPLPVPTIASIEPAHLLVGAATTITITGSEFASPVIVTAADITFSNVRVVDARTITAIANVAASAQGGNTDVKVNANDQDSNPVAVKKQIPAGIVRYSYPPLAPGGITALTTITDGNVTNLAGTVLKTHQCGMFRNYAYDLVDQDGVSIQAVYAFTEYFTDYVGVVDTPPDQNYQIDASSLLADIQFFGKNAPNCPGPDDHETFNQKFYVKSGNQRFDLTTVINIKRGNYGGIATVDEVITKQ